MKLAGNGQRAVATDHDETVDPHLSKGLGDLLGPIGIVVWTAPTGAQQRATFRQHATQRADVELHRATLSHAIPGIEKADELVAKVQFTFADDCSNDRVESRTITATCQNANAHVCTR